MSEKPGAPESLAKWINEYIPSWLVEMSERFEQAEGWKMPIVEDYVLIFAVKDIEDGETGVFALANKDCSEYRIRGLLNVAYK